MAKPAPANSSGREGRLLVVTLVLSAVLLVVLARFRFPEAQGPPNPSMMGASLDRLAARSTYDDLARVIADVEGRVYPSTLVLEVEGDDEDVAGLRVPTRPVPALRIRDSMALVALHPGQQVIGLRGQTGPAQVVGRDDIRNVAVVAIPTATAPTFSVGPDATAGAPPRYVAVVEASRSGPSVRPLFLGRLDPVDDPRWGRSLISVGSLLSAQPGSILFTLSGELLGLVVTSAGVRTLVPASLVLETAAALAEGRSQSRGHLGLDWQPLTPSISRATGATTGVVVAGVHAAGPAAGRLQPGDVVQSVGGRAVRSVSEAHLLGAAVAPDERVPLLITRAGAAVEVEVVAAATTTSPAPATTRALGLTLRAGAGGAGVVAVTAGGAAALAGLRPGDRITHIDHQPVTPGNNFVREFSASAPGRAFLLTVVRDDRTVVTAIEKP